MRLELFIGNFSVEIIFPSIFHGEKFKKLWCLVWKSFGFYGCWKFQAGVDLNYMYSFEIEFPLKI